MEDIKAEFEVKVIDITYYSIGFPQENQYDLISRDNFISQIIDYFNKGIDIVFLEGDEDIGKTTFCSQFAKKYEHTITLFFKNQQFDLSVEYIYENIIPQSKYLLGCKEIESLDNFNSTDYRQIIYQLRKWARQSGKNIYLIIDGLENSVNTLSNIKDLIQQLPFDETIFKFIITGNSKDFIKGFPNLNKREYETLRLPGFSRMEVIKYLNLCEDIPSEFEDLLKITKAYPGRLKTLRRLIGEKGYSLKEIISDTTNYTNWIEYDFEDVDVDDNIIVVILALISLTNNNYTFNELSQICLIDVDTIKDRIGKIKVLEVSDSLVKFVSKEHKKYISTRLIVHKKDIDNLLVEYYYNSGNIKSKVELCKFWAERKQWSKITNIIDTDFITNLLQSTETLQLVNESFDIGLKASFEMKNHNDSWKYSIQGSILNELDNYLFWESEIEARIAIGDFNGAVTLAESAIIRVERLRLLALIARRQKELNENVDEDLITLITDLYKNTDISYIGEKIYDIVGDLIYALPNIAIEIIEQSSSHSASNNINDWIITKLSVAAIESNNKDGDDSSKIKKIEALENLNNPSVRKIYRAISFLVGNYSAKKVLFEVNKLKDSNEKLRLLRLWLNNNKNKIDEIEVVIEQALEALIQSTSESSTLYDVLTELSIQLPHIRNDEKRTSLLKRFKSIESSLTGIGLSKNIYIYKMNVFHAEFLTSRYFALDKIDQILYEISEITDVLIKIECYAEVYTKLSFIKSEIFLERKENVQNLIVDLSKILYANTANHYEISKYFIRTISKVNPTLSHKIASFANTIFRREKLRMLILESYLDNNIKFIDLKILLEIEKTYELPNSKEAHCIRVIERYAECKSLHHKVIKDLLCYIHKLDSSKESESKLYGYTLMLKILNKNPEWFSKLGNSVELKIQRSVNETEADWSKINQGFFLCSELSSVDKRFSERIFNETVKFKEESWIDSQLIAYTYFNCIKLVFRAFAGLIVTKNNVMDDIELIKNFISKIPLSEKRINLWCELVLICYEYDSHLAKTIYNKYILPTIQTYLDSNNDLFKIKKAFVVMHIYNQELAIEYIQKQPKTRRDNIYYYICRYYLTKENPYDYYDSEVSKYNCSYSEIINAISLGKLLETDYIIYQLVTEIAKSVSSNSNQISKTQVLTIADRLKDMIQGKLPDNDNIKHSGYDIITRLRIARIKKENIKCEEYLREAEDIPNLSDKIFVKSLYFELLPFDGTTGSELKKELFEDIIQKLNSFNIHYEYIQRVIDISDNMFSVDKTRWKEITSKAFSLTNELESGKEIYSSQKGLIDSIYRFDENFAKELVRTNEAVADKNVQQLLSQHYESLELAKKIKKNQSVDNIEKENLKVIVNGIFNALKALNSGKISSRKLEDVSKYLLIANRVPLHEVFPIYMYYLANCVRTYKHNKQPGSEIHRLNFKEIVNATNLIHLFSQRRKLTSTKSRTIFKDNISISNKPITPNSREEAIEFIRDWMEKEASEYVIFVDPYFNASDLDFVALLMAINKEIEVEILGSREGQKIDVERAFINYWKSISDEIPPVNNITFCWNPENNLKEPFHDRWILTKNSGLRLGTSFSSIGLTRDSEISIMKLHEVDNIAQNIVNDYITKQKKVLNNQRLKYRSFSLYPD